MTDIFKTFLKANRLARKGRPLSAALALHSALAPSPKAGKRESIPKDRKARRKSGAALPSRPAPGSFTAGKFSSPHGEIAYKLYTPKGSTRRRLPLVVMLHGCSQTANDFALGTGLNAFADELGVLILYPEQNQSANLARCWNWHRADNQKRGHGEPALIAALTRHSLALAKGHPDRVYIAGLSAGGAAAAIIGAAYPDIFVAVAVHSGVARGDIQSLGAAMSAMRGKPKSASIGKLPRQLPTIVFHGDEDRVVHPSNAGGFLVNLERSMPGELVTQSFSGESERGKAFTRKLYKSRCGELLLEDWTVHGSGHGWSGGSIVASYTDPSGPNASREILRFFLSKRRIPRTPRPAQVAKSTGH